MAHVMLFPMLNVLYLYISTSRSMCAVPSVAVLCSSLMSCFPVAAINTGITSVFTFHIHCISILRSLYFIISASFLITFIPSKIATYINIHVPLLLPRIMMSDLLLQMALFIVIITGSDGSGNFQNEMSQTCFGRKNVFC